MQAIIESPGYAFVISSIFSIIYHCNATLWLFSFFFLSLGKSSYSLLSNPFHLIFSYSHSFSIFLLVLINLNLLIFFIIVALSNLILLIILSFPIRSFLPSTNCELWRTIEQLELCSSSLRPPTSLTFLFYHMWTMDI